MTTTTTDQQEEQLRKAREHVERCTKEAQAWPPNQGAASRLRSAMDDLQWLEDKYGEVNQQRRRGA